MRVGAAAVDIVMGTRVCGVMAAAGTVAVWVTYKNISLFLRGQFVRHSRLHEAFFAQFSRLLALVFHQ